MSFNRIITLAAIGWATTVAVSFMTRVTLLATVLSSAELAGWIFLIAAPVAVALAVFRGPSSSIAQLLYDAEHASTPQSRS